MLSNCTNHFQISYLLCNFTMIKNLHQPFSNFISSSITFSHFIFNFISYLQICHAFHLHQPFSDFIFSLQIGTSFSNLHLHKYYHECHTTIVPQPSAHPCEPREGKYMYRLANPRKEFRIHQGDSLNKYKFTNTNIQIQICKSKYTNTNIHIQLQIQIYKYNPINTNVHI